MYRIDNATAAAALPTPAAVGPNPNGFFTKGDPVGGVQATVVDDDWANAVQEEISQVIEGAGLTLSKVDHTQLRQAITSMIAGSGHAVIIESATFEASVANGEVVYWDSANSRFDGALADGSSSQNAVGIADVTNGKVYAFGKSALFTGLTPGSKYYLSGTTPGAVTTTSPASNAVVIGIAKSATEMFVDIDASSSPSAKSTAKAWCQFDGTLTGTNAPLAGHNVTSVTRNSTGTYTINFTNALSTAAFAAVSTGNGGYISWVNAYSTTSVTVNQVNNVLTAVDSPLVSVIVFGD